MLFLYLLDHLNLAMEVNKVKTAQKYFINQIFDSMFG